MFHIQFQFLIKLFKFHVSFQNCCNCFFLFFSSVLKFRKYRFEKPLDLFKGEDRATKARTLVPQHDDNKVPFSLSRKFHNKSTSLNLQVSPDENMMKKLTILFENSDILDKPSSNINNKYSPQSSPNDRLVQINDINTFGAADTRYDFHQANFFLDSARTFNSKHKIFSPLDNEAYHNIFTSVIKEKVRQAKTVYVFDEVHRAITGNITTTSLPNIDFQDSQILKINIDSTAEAQHEKDQVTLALDDVTPRETNNESVSLSKTPSNMQNETEIKDQPFVVTFPISNFDNKILMEELPVTPITNISNDYQNVLTCLPPNLQSNEDEIKKHIVPSNEISSCINRLYRSLSSQACVHPVSSTMMKACKHDKSAQTAMSKICKRSVKISTDWNELSRNDSCLSKSSHCEFVNNDIHLNNRGAKVLSSEEKRKELRIKFDLDKNQMVNKNESSRNSRDKILNFKTTQEKHVDIYTSKVSPRNRDTQLLADVSKVSKTNHGFFCQNRNIVFQQRPGSYQFNSTCAPGYVPHQIHGEDKFAMPGVLKCSVCPHSQFSSFDPRRYSHTVPIYKPHRTPIISNFLSFPKSIQHPFIPDYCKSFHAII